MSTYSSSPYGMEHSRRPSVWTYLGPLLILMAIAGLIGWLAGLWGRPGRLHDPEVTPRAVEPRGKLADDEITTIGIFEKASPSVVYITTLQIDRFSLDQEAV